MPVCRLPDTRGAYGRMLIPRTIPWEHLALNGKFTRTNRRHGNEWDPHTVPDATGVGAPPT